VIEEVEDELWPSWAVRSNVGLRLLTEQIAVVT
jgi:hypothetical protein